MSEESIELDTLEQHFEETIRAMGARFTTHEFLLRLAYDYQREYVAGLAAYAQGGKPFRDLHHALVKRLKNLDGKLIALRKENYPSRDIFGTPSHSGLWRKL